jgi:hypothetical protein
MPKEFKIGDTRLFSQVITLEDRNESMIKSNLHDHSSKSIMIDVLLMLLCERSGSNPRMEDPDLNSD